MVPGTGYLIILSTSDTLGMRWHKAEHLRALVAKAAQAGADVTPARVQWNIAGGCLTPFVSEHGTRDPHYRAWLSISVRCRKCKPCLARRRGQWAERAVLEFISTEARERRTWFGTLTLKPQQAAMLLARADKRARQRGETFNATDKDAWTHLALAGSPLVTAYLKRVRKAAVSTLRYVVVAEPHKSGLVHQQMPVHQS